MQQVGREVFRGNIAAWSYLAVGLMAVGVGMAITLVGPVGAAAGAALGLGALIVARRPELGVLGLLLATSTIFAERDMPRLAIGVGRLYLTDVLLLGLLSLVILRVLLGSATIVRTPLDVPMLAFVGLALLATLVGVAAGRVEPKLAVTECRYVLYYLLFFAVTQLVRGRASLRRLVSGLYVLAAGVALVMIWEFFVGHPVTAGRVEQLVTEGRQYAEVTRIRPPGEPLALLAFLACAAGLLTRPFAARKAGHLLLAALFGVALLLTFDRSVWIGVAAALLLLSCLLGRAGRRVLLTWVPPAGLAVAALLVLLVLASQSPLGTLARATGERVASLISGDALHGQESTWRWRRFEYTHALPEVATHPLLGLGLGARYRPYLAGVDWEGVEEGGYDGRRYLHNGHLWLILKTGVLGYVCFLWLTARALRRTLLALPGTKGTPRGLVLGIGLTYVAMLIAALALSILMEWPWIAVIGTMLGVAEVALRAPGSGEEAGAHARG